MHFINRASFTEAPLTILSTLNLQERDKWLNYKNYLLNKTGEAVNRPESKWYNDAIRDPLLLLFNSNCAYCGDYADKNNDGEVDHFIPISNDSSAELIYNRDNYIWACHSCNNKKRNKFPIINPCIKIETDQIFINSASGRYLIYNDASTELKYKFEQTEIFTYINGKIFPQRRKNVISKFEIFL